MMRKETFGLAALCLALGLLATTGISSAAALKTHKNSIGMEFVLIPAGSFSLSDEVVQKNDFDEVTGRYKPKIIVSKPFYLGKYEVTQEEWVTVMGTGSNPSHFKGRKNPVEQISWNDAQEFIRRLNAKEGHSRYRLPTSMEWELAARGGTNTTYFFGESEGSLGQYAWFHDNSGGKTHPVGQKRPNQYGLYDIYGNVWELVHDRYSGSYLPTNRENRDYRGHGSGSSVIVRGGGWRGARGSSDIWDGTRPDHRYYLSPTYSVMGFRLALSPE